VCAEYRNPVGIITKAPLIERDLDVLVELHRRARVSVTVSVPFFDEAKARAIEPFVATPHRRLRTVEKLARAGLDVGVNIAPMIPGLNDEDLPRTLEAAARAGATRAGFVFLRLPGSVKQVFEERLRAAFPLRAEKILARIRDGRGGALYDPRWGKRQRGEGPYAESALALFETTCRRLGLNGKEMTPPQPTAPTFERPPKPGHQLKLL
jgi:DNA repair photolyase